MRIMLIQPGMNMRPMDTKLKTRMAPALSLLTLIALTPSKHDVFIVNENIEEINFLEDVDLVGITVTVDVFNRAVEIARQFQKRGIKVVAGGIHISACPEECAPYFDAICAGMAERIWKNVVEDAENNTLKNIYCDMKDMKGSEIVSPAYSAIDNRKYFYTNIISTSRGCPFKCDFCYNSCELSPDHMKRPIDDVLREIKELNTNHIMFIDDNFIGDIHWLKNFLDKIRPLDMKWNCAVSANILNHLDLLDEMAETGCQSLFIGFESINNASLKSVHKIQNNILNYDRLISEIHKRGMMINASLVFGLPDDDKNVFDATLDWLVKNKVETVTAHILTPYPGTKLYKKMKSENKIFDHDLSHYNTAPVVFYPEKMTVEELYDGYIHFYEKFYSFKNILKRIPQNRKQWTAYFLFNFFYRKWGKFTEKISDYIPLNKIGKLGSKLSYRHK